MAYDQNSESSSEYIIVGFMASQLSSARAWQSEWLHLSLATLGTIFIVVLVFGVSISLSLIVSPIIILLMAFKLVRYERVREMMASEYLYIDRYEDKY